jgi:DNA polymerase alpha-associated DNA helicase A
MDDLLSKASSTRGRAEKRKIYSELKDLRKDFRAREQNVLNDLLNNAQVVLSTLNGSASKNLYNQKFDILIIDEATQALEAECWIAITQCPKVIFAGDHHQLPPTVKSSNTKLETTLFLRSLTFHGDCIRVMLNEQFRMHQDIMEYSSHNLYEDKLTAHSSVKSHLLSDLEEVDANSDDIVNTPLLFVDTAGSDLLESSTTDINDNNSNSLGKLVDDSKLNMGEVQLVISHLKLLISTGVKPSQIAIISPYNGQVTQLISEIKPEFPEVEIGTVDGFQGREKEAVILSLVRSNFDHQVGFLMDYRRLNVAITRAKRHLCIIGDSDTVMSPQPTSPTLKEKKSDKKDDKKNDKKEGKKEDKSSDKIDGAKFLIDLGEYLNDRGEVWTPEMYSD